MPGTRVVRNPNPTAGTMQGHDKFEYVAAPLNAHNPNPLGGFTRSGSENNTGKFISWTAETLQNFVPPLSVSKTEMTKVMPQYSPAMMCVGTWGEKKYSGKTSQDRTSILQVCCSSRPRVGCDGQIPDNSTTITTIATKTGDI